MSESKEVVIAKSQGLEIQNWDDLMRRAEFLATSQLIPQALRNKPADVAVILQMGLELGIPPMQAINGIDVIQGKPTVSPQLGLALSRARAEDFRVEWVKLDDTVAQIVVHRGKESYPATWTAERARKLGLAGKDNYQKQQGTMLKWRAVGEALRALCSDILKGFYLEGEMDGVDGDGEGSDDKAARLKALNQAKPEMKDVVAEVESEPAITPEPPVAHSPKPEPKVAVAPPKIAPEPEPQWDIGATVQNEPEFNPLAEYEIKMRHPRNTGKKLKDVPKAELELMLKAVRDHATSTKSEIRGVVLEDVTRIDDYLRTTADSFNFEPGASG